MQKSDYRFSFCFQGQLHHAPNIFLSSCGAYLWKYFLLLLKPSHRYFHKNIVLQYEVCLLYSSYGFFHFSCCPTFLLINVLRFYTDTALKLPLTTADKTALFIAAVRTLRINELMLAKSRGSGNCAHRVCQPKRCPSSCAISLSGVSVFCVSIKTPSLA